MFTEGIQRKEIRKYYGIQVNSYKLFASKQVVY